MANVEVRDLDIDPTEMPLGDTFGLVHQDCVDSDDDEDDGDG